MHIVSPENLLILARLNIGVNFCCTCTCLFQLGKQTIELIQTAKTDGQTTRTFAVG